MAKREVEITDFELKNQDFDYSISKPEQSLTIEWKESFELPGKDKGHYELNISSDAYVEISAIFIPDLGKKISLEEYKKDAKSIHYILKFNSKSIIWFEDTEAKSERFMEVFIKITQRPPDTKACRVVLTIRDNYIPNAEVQKFTMPASARTSFKYH